MVLILYYFAPLGYRIWLGRISHDLRDVWRVRVKSVFEAGLKSRIETKVIE